MSEWIQCMKCGTTHENMCACPEPTIQQPDEEKIYSPCKGTNCDCTDGLSHSKECIAEYEAQFENFSPCCGVKFDTDIRICPKCKEHV